MLPAELAAIEGMTPDELADLEDGDFDEDEQVTQIPLEDLLLKCACAKADCSVQAAFGIANGKLKIG